MTEPKKPSPTARILAAASARTSPFLAHTIARLVKLPTDQVERALVKDGYPCRPTNPRTWLPK